MRLLQDSKLAILTRRAVLLKLEQTLRVFAIEKVEKMLFLLDEPRLAQLTLQLA